MKRLYVVPVIGLFFFVFAQFIQIKNLVFGFVDVDSAICDCKERCFLGLWVSSVFLGAKKLNYRFKVGFPRPSFFVLPFILVLRLLPKLLLIVGSFTFRRVSKISAFFGRYATKVYSRSWISQYVLCATFA